MEVDEKLTKQVTEVKYLSVENTERYRPIMRYFFKQYEKLEYWLYKEDVFIALKDNPMFLEYTLELCEQDLLKLTEWGNLTNIQDTSNVQTVEEFKNRKYRYQLTEYAIEIERMVMRLETLKVETASLEPKLFEKLRLLLDKITTIDDISDLHATFEEIDETFTKLNNNYKDFLKMFHEAKSEELMKSEQFLIYKDKVIEYLKNFIAGFQVNEIKIKKVLSEYPENFEDILMEKIMTYKKNQPILEPDFDFDYLEEILRGKWRSIIKWFSTEKLEDSETERLKRAINNIINKITKYVMAIMETGTSVNRMEEYRHILSLFLQADTLEEIEQLSTTVFGIEKVKHFSNLESIDSVLENPKDVNPVFISLKSHNRKIKEKAIRNQVEDKTYQKEEQLKKIMEEAHQREQLLKKYIQEGQIIIKELNNIAPFERRFILSLLTKGHGKEIVRNNEYGIFYKIENISDDVINLDCIDGTLAMNNIKITFIGEEHGI